MLKLTHNSLFFNLNLKNLPSCAYKQKVLKWDKIRSFLHSHFNATSTPLQRHFNTKNAGTNSYLTRRIKPIFGTGPW
jgi:hypothetical protein